MLPCAVRSHCTSPRITLTASLQRKTANCPGKKAWFATTLGLTRVRLTLRCMANFVIKVLDQSERVYAVRDAL